MNLENFMTNAKWKELLKSEFQKEYFLKINENYQKALDEKKVIYPSLNLIFNAFNLTPFEEVKVVILGQDPYHKPFEAMGLSFSVPCGVKIPPSLMNIFKELHNDLGIKICKNGDLSAWAKQGVLLLNSIFSVEQNHPASHSSWKWQNFSDAVISLLSEQKQGLIFLLWGNFAKSKKNLINTKKHFVLEAAHPSPLAGGKFFGCRHFSKTNEILKAQGKEEIDWNLNKVE